MGEIVSQEATLPPAWKEIRQKGDERGELTMLKGGGRSGAKTWGKWRFCIQIS